MDEGKKKVDPKQLLEVLENQVKTFIACNTIALPRNPKRFVPYSSISRAFEKSMNTTIGARALWFKAYLKRQLTHEYMEYKHKEEKDDSVNEKKDPECKERVCSELVFYWGINRTTNKKIGLKVLSDK